MFERKSLRFPITLGVTMIVLLVALIIGWILLTVVNALRDPYSTLNWTFLAMGTPILGFILVGVVMYLTLTIKTIRSQSASIQFYRQRHPRTQDAGGVAEALFANHNRQQITDEEHAKFHKFMMDDVERLDQLISHMLDAGASGQAQGRQANRWMLNCRS